MCGTGNVRLHKRALAPEAPLLVFQVRKFLVGVPSFGMFQWACHCGNSVFFTDFLYELCALFWDVFGGHALMEILSFGQIFYINFVFWTEDKIMRLLLVMDYLIWFLFFG